jgi:S1-C subfamily serine protease
MSSLEAQTLTSPFAGLEVDKALRPSAGAFAFDLNAILMSVVALEATVSDDASTAEALGTNRIGNGIVIGAEGLVLTIGYLITEADEVILTTGDGRRVQAHVLGVDPATGFGLLHALEPLNLPALPIGDSHSVGKAETVLIAGAGGRPHSLAGVLLARAPFAGYWEYYLDEALFVGPAHPHWSGAALINGAGELVGVGSLYVEQRAADGEVQPLNMFVPTELLQPILADLRAGRPARAPRPWIGVIAQDVDSLVVVLDVSEGGPADQAGLEQGDVIRTIGGETVTDLAGFYRSLWALGPPGTTARVVVQRDQQMLSIDIQTIDRTARLKKRRLN